MNILDFLQQSFHLTDNGMKSAQLIEKLTEESFTYKNDYIIKKSSNAYKEELTIQKEIANSTSSAMPGLEELINALSCMAPDAIISMRFIDGPNWDGRIFYDEKNTLTGVIIGKKKNRDWKTPPNWDGSEEMLKTYNTK
ncbi:MULTISPECIES: hypothetical protein [unclassified Pseudomonas]|uniref:hypothetical protein n=1 Tax=unclassified Pseudomonas TaxID=196821 RepID=UPI0019119411|nr:MULTISPECIES: hypothetical protein [unclassified Pseudomonas]MBK5553349.1 hypothetical protein [Pseudomonas sp. TH03]MEB0229122.1 hypothetical protein [Pseudomonas sp. 5S1]MEB0299110.1 hypothetical protein [Pseudomonas sp. 10S4]WPX21612.1 hypothetical protein RHM58_28570 [Pseudomonas sp. 10S4]